MQRMRSVPCDKSETERETETKKENENDLRLVLQYFEHPESDNERLLNYQYDYLVNKNQEAWSELWSLSIKTAGQCLAHICRKYHKTIPSDLWEDYKIDVAMYVLRRYTTHQNYCIKKEFVYQLYLSARNKLLQVKKSEKCIEFVSDEEMEILLNEHTIYDRSED